QGVVPRAPSENSPRGQLSGKRANGLTSTERLGAKRSLSKIDHFQQSASPQASVNRHDNHYETFKQLPRRQNWGLQPEHDHQKRTATIVPNETIKLNLITQAATGGGPLRQLSKL
ncbi:MAG: hypothetical protein WA161_13370, partial [Pseudomonas sp.]|uniref:hypothetical protein n=1 Tax=Pseudomonas sp. TaxID=306 RepID=UPI003BB578FF